MYGPLSVWNSVEIFPCGLRWRALKASAVCGSSRASTSIPAARRQIELRPSAAITSRARAAAPDASRSVTPTASGSTAVTGSSRTFTSRAAFTAARNASCKCTFAMLYPNAGRPSSAAEKVVSGARNKRRVASTSRSRSSGAALSARLDQTPIACRISTEPPSSAVVRRSGAAGRGAIRSVSIPADENISAATSPEGPPPTIAISVVQEFCIVLNAGRFPIEARASMR